MGNARAAWASCNPGHKVQDGREASGKVVKVLAGLSVPGSTLEIGSKEYR